ncbi:VWA domain-containing protein [Yoonia vestfoldensis]|uniref:VWA domain-containing protein n=1 Tax=Yoonia vestfoldensis TaxID=245188 RepID=UPI0003A472A4|nr:VWA domain-containing protein [Yoonia vestfoldensis]
MRSALYAFFLTIWVISPIASWAQDRASILILDASGSMWAQLDGGKSRIEVARDVLADFLSARDPAQPLGVIAYGHNRKGDCADIEVLANVATQDGATLGARLRALNPRGKTPLADALRLAASQIPATSEEADIVLVTDGLETCGGDVCAVAAELAANGIPVRAHVVGFGLTEGEIAQISCIADQTGGLLLSTQSGAELADALVRTTAPVIVESLPAGQALMNVTIRADIAGRPDQVAIRAENAATGNVQDFGILDFAQAAALPVLLREGDWTIIADAGELGGGQLDITVLADDNRTIYVPFRGLLPTLDMPPPTGAFRAGINALIPYRVLQEGLATGGGDFIFSLLPLDATTTTDRRYTYSTQDSRVGGHVGAFQHPPVPGDYLVAFSRNAALPIEEAMKTLVVTFVDRPEVTLVAPPAVAPGAQIPVTITGGMGSNDRLEVWRDGALVSWDHSVNLQDFFDNRYGPAKPLIAPEEAGAYEVVYVFSELDAATNVAARLPLTVGTLLDFQEEASLPPGPQSAGSRVAGYEQNSDRGGFDIAATPLDQPDPRFCDALCAADPNCAAWTFVKAGLQGPQAMCWTKYASGEARQSECCVSGVMADLARLGPTAQVTAVAADDADDVAMNDDVGYRCDQAICLIEDATTGLNFALPQGWFTDLPTLESAVAGGQPGAPRVNFMSDSNGQTETIALNPHQWTTMNGPCMDLSMGQLCYFESADPTVAQVAAVLSQTLRWTSPAMSTVEIDMTHGPDAVLPPALIGYTCAQDGFPCIIVDEPTGIALVIPARWFTDIPVLEPAPPGSTLDMARLTFYSPMEVPDVIAINPLDWSPDRGPCTEFRYGLACLTTAGAPSTQAAFDLIVDKLFLTRPAVRAAPAADPQDALAAIIGTLAQEDPAAAAAMAGLLGAAQGAVHGGSDAMPGAIISHGYTPGPVLKRCPLDAPCAFAQPDVQLAGAMPSGWTVEVAVRQPDTSIATWFTDVDPAGNVKRIGLNQPGGEACIDTRAGPLCEFTPYIAGSEMDVIARTLTRGGIAEAEAALAAYQSVVPPQGTMMTPESVGALLERIRTGQGN